jgi:kumamolisin
MCAEKNREKVSKDHHQLAGSERPRPSGHKPIGPADAAELIGITLVVRPRPGSPPLPTLEHWQATPLSKRSYLTPEEYARKHGAADEDLAAAAAFAKSKGLRVTESHAGRRTVTVLGTAAQLNAAFGVTLNHYEAPVPSLGRARKSGSPVAEAAAVKTHIYHGYDGPVTLPGELAGVVHAVIGLDNRRRSVAAGRTGDPAGAAYNPVPTVAGYYNFPTTGAADQTIGVHAPGGSAYQHADIATYFSNITDPNYQTPPSVLNDISLNVGGTTWSNDQASVSFSNNADLELTQDISTSATIAQGATMNVYFTEDSEQGWLVFLNRVLLPESEPQPTAITSSFPLTLDDSSSSIGSLSDTS